MNGRLKTGIDFFLSLSGFQSLNDGIFTSYNKMEPNKQTDAI